MSSTLDCCVNVFVSKRIVYGRRSFSGSFDKNARKMATSCPSVSILRKNTPMFSSSKNVPSVLQDIVSFCIIFF
jgi:hypothetical protein